MEKLVGYTYNGKVVKVVDGDTFDIMLDLGFATYRKVRCRLLKINAPEAKTPDGDIITAYLRVHLADKNVLVRSKKLDCYGRSLADIEVSQDGVLFDLATSLTTKFSTINLSDR